MGVMVKIAASTLAFLNQPLDKTFESIDELGFDGVEIYYEGAHSLDVKSLLDITLSHDMALYLHAPFSDLNLASFNEAVLDESLRQIKDSIGAAAAIDSLVVTVHFGRYSPIALSFPEKAFERNLSNIEKIASFGEEMGVNVSFENSPKGFGVMVGGLEKLQEITRDLGVSITLDIGHAHTWDEGLENFVKGLDKSIAHTHVHDNMGEVDMHLPVGEGSIDFEGFFRSLNEINYKKALTLELLRMEDVILSLDRIKDLTGR